MIRYGIISEKDPREIVLLRGRGCFYKKCTFCDYHLDASLDDEANFALNQAVLEKVTGLYHNLEVINSGSFHELDERTLSLIGEIAQKKQIKILHFEAHYLVRELIPQLRARYSAFEVRMRLGLETFDYALRENYLKKGIASNSPEDIAKDFQEANFLFGITGQTLDSMNKDIELGLKYFQRITVNIMCDNTTPIKPDQKVIALFKEKIYPKIKDDARIDILINNTDFGVGTPE